MKFARPTSLKKIISKGVCDIIEACGATGFIIVEAGGKGSRDVRSSAERASLVDDFTNVKIEVIVNNAAMAERIMDGVRDKYFENYSGINYLEDIRVLRPEKFTK